MTFNIGGVPMQYPIILGAGVIRYPHQLNNVMRSDIPLGAVELGSVVPAKSLGNDGQPLFWPAHWSDFLKEQAGLNCFGMPSDGPEETHAGLPSATPIPLIIGAAGKVPQEFINIIAMFDKHPAVCAHNLNVACPNLKLPPIGYSVEAIQELLLMLRKMRLSRPVWFKIPRYMTKEELAEFASLHPEFDFSATPTVSPWFVRILCDLLLEFSDVISAVVSANTLGSVVRRDANGKTVTAPNDGKAGLSGPIIMSSTLSLLDQLTEFLGNTIPVIAAGGLVNGDDVCHVINHGAVAAYLASAPYWHGDPARFFAEMLQENDRLQDLLLQHMQQ